MVQMVQATFVLEHPTDIDLRKVDRIWFLDYVEYKLNATVSFETSLLVKRQRARETVGA
jgi:hypothetical protein